MALDIEKNIEVLEDKAAARRGIWVLLWALLQSRYFLISLSIYLGLLFAFSGYVISKYIPNLGGTFEETSKLLVLPPPMQQPPKPKEQVKDTKETPVRTTTTKTAVQRITVDSPATFVRKESPHVAPKIKIAEVKIETKMSEKIRQGEMKRLANVRQFQKGWQVRDTGKATKAKFTIYQAKYQDGDWNCNPSALGNLMLQIRAWSRDRLDANLYPEVLDVGTEQIFTIRPPFIYLTGHKDFHFLDSEVRNLRDYLMVGGAIWGDSALAGRRSRFDIAFRREMAKVMPDRDFEIVKPDHPMFNTFFQDIDLPIGINYYHEPAEMINIGDELAVLYTLNGYGHFWEARLNRDNKIEWGPVRVNVGTAEKPEWRWQHVYGPHLYPPREESGIIYRNINDKTVTDAYKFGINVVVHLLIRYQEKFRFLPKDLPASDYRLTQTEKALGAKGTNAPARTEAEDKEAPASGSKKDKHKDNDKPPAKPGGKK